MERKEGKRKGEGRRRKGKRKEKHRKKKSRDEKGEKKKRRWLSYHRFLMGTDNPSSSSCPPFFFFFFFPFLFTYHEKRLIFLEKKLDEIKDFGNFVEIHILEKKMDFNRNVPKSIPKFLKGVFCSDSHLD